jgi:hypothetical protein
MVVMSKILQHQLITTCLGNKKKIASMYEFSFTHHQSIITLRQKNFVTSMVLVVAMVGFSLANPSNPLQFKFHKFHYGPKNMLIIVPSHTTITTKLDNGFIPNGCTMFHLNHL